MAKNEIPVNLDSHQSTVQPAQLQGNVAQTPIPPAPKQPLKEKNSANDVLVLELTHPSERVGKQKTIPAFLGKRRKYRMTATGIGVRIVSCTSGRVMLMPWPNITSCEMTEKEEV